MYSDGFHRSFCDNDEDLDVIQESDSIFAFETPELFRPEQIRSKRCGTPSCSFPPNVFSNDLKCRITSMRNRLKGVRLSSVFTFQEARMQISIRTT